MTRLLLALLCGQELQDLVERALAEENRETRRAAVAALRPFPFRDLEQAVRRPKRGPSPIEPGKIAERAHGDGARYAVHVPAAYDPARTWPLLVTLHGTNAGADPAAGRAWIQTWLRCAKARDEAVLLAPTTTRHTWSARPAHDAVLGAVRELQRDLNIDPERIHVDGMSMGGGGAFRLAEHVPDRWASIGPRCNVPDVRQKRDGTLVTMLAENLRNVPVYWVVGAKDGKIPVAFARAAREAFQTAQVDCVYREFPDGGHDWSLEDDATVFDWYRLNPRRTYPEELTFRSWEKAFQRAYWVEILSRTENGPVVMVHLDMQGGESERRTEFRPPARVQARRKDNTLTLLTEEVRELRVWLDDAFVDLDKPVAIAVNGKKLHDAIVKRSADTLIEEARRRDERGMTFSAFVDLKVR